MLSSSQPDIHVPAYSMATTLLDLPPELIATTFHHLNDADFFAARAVGKYLERASFATFGKRFFRKKGYMITTASLDVLQNIASHEELRPYVQHVWFNPDCYTFGHLLKHPNSLDDFQKIHPADRYSDDYETNGKNREAHVECLKDHKRLLNSGDPAKHLACMDDDLDSLKAEGALSDKLVTVFSSLPNLRTIGMRRSDQYSPWGWKGLRDAVGRDPRELGDYLKYDIAGAHGPTLLYAALLRALDASGTKIQRFYTDAIEIDLLSVDTLPLDVVARACSSLLYLEVNVTKGRISMLIRPPGEETDRIRSQQRLQYGSGLIRLLSASPKLRELGLMIFPNRTQSHLMPPDEGWELSYPYLSLVHLADNVQLQNLRRIKLEKFTTSPTTLISLLQPSAKQLTSIKLRDIRLLSDSSAGDEKPWQPVFSFLATSCPKLSYLLLYHLSHPTGTIRFVQNLPVPETHDNPADSMALPVNFTDYEHISVEAGVPHSDPDTVGPEKRATVREAREAVSERVHALVEGHWYGKNTFSYEMDESLWHTDTSDEEW